MVRASGNRDVLRFINASLSSGQTKVDGWKLWYWLAEREDYKLWDRWLECLAKCSLACISGQPSTLYMLSTLCTANTKSCFKSSTSPYQLVKINSCTLNCNVFKTFIIKRVPSKRVSYMLLESTHTHTQAVHIPKTILNFSKELVWLK